MKTTKIFSLCVVLLFCCVFTATAQSFRGVVASIVDGRTVNIKTDNGGEIRAMMVFIEIPEPQQQLSQIVVDHLGKLVLGKKVRFVQTSSFSQGALGVLYLISPSGEQYSKEVEINIAVQMLRDGAAWFDLPGYGNAADRKIYQEMESLARQEKRGVWSIDGMKTAWQFREEEFQRKIDEKQAKILNDSKNKSKPDTMWADVGTTGGKGFALESNYDRFTDETHVRTIETLVSFTGGGEGNVLLIRAGEYFQGTDPSTTKKRRYTLSFHASGNLLIIPTLPELRLIGSGGERFLIKESDLSFPRENYVKSNENLFNDVDKIYTYQLTEAQFKMIRSGGAFRFGFWEGNLPASILSSLP